MAAKKKTDETEALTKANAQIAKLKGANEELTELVTEVARVDPSDPKLARKHASTARGAATGSRHLGAAAGGAMSGFGFVGKIAAGLLGVIGSAAEMLGAGDGKGAGRRLVNFGSGMASGAIGAAASDGVRALRTKKQDNQEL